MAQLHVIEKLTLTEQIDKVEQIWSTGYWKLSEERARALIDGDLYLHRKKASPSFFGGIITGFRVEEAGDYAGRIIFTFKADLAHKNVTASPEGWKLEMKFIP